jgi:hypothetical protein
MPKTKIAVNTNISDVIDTAGNVAHMLYIPGNITNTAFTFLVGQDASAVTTPLEDGNKNPVSVSFNAGAAVPLDTSIFASVRFLKLVGSINETGADKIIGISFIQG